jgi:hypothetical protein
MKRWKTLSLTEGLTICCKHFEVHDNDCTSSQLEIRNQESDYQDLEIVSVPKRASRKRKRANIASTSARSPDALMSATPRFSWPMKESAMNSLLKGEESQEDEIEDWNLESSFKTSSPGLRPHNQLCSKTSELTESNKHVSSSSYGISSDNHEVDEKTREQAELLRDAYSTILTLKTQIEQLSRDLETSQSLLQQIKLEMSPMSCLLAILHIGDSYTPLAQNDSIEPLYKTKIAEERILWLGIDNFEELWNDTLRNKEYERRGPPSKFSRMEQLAITLIWIRRGFPKSVLATMCGLSDRRIDAIVSEIVDDLQTWTSKMLQLPEIDFWRHCTPPSFQETFPNTLLFFVDGTILPLFHSQVTEFNKAHWNPKHKILSISFTILVTPNGRVVFVSEPYPGKWHDRKVWYRSGINEALVKKYFRQMLDLRAENDGPILAIGGDKGYLGLIFPEQWRLYITKSVPNAAESEELSGFSQVKHEDKISDNIKIHVLAGDQRKTHSFAVGKVRREMQMYPKHLAKFRSTVERSIGTIKDWQLLQNRYFTSNTYITSISPVIRIVCALLNLNIDRSLQLYLVPHLSQSFFRLWRWRAFRSCSFPSSFLGLFNLVLNLCTILWYIYHVVQILVPL